MWRPKQPLPRAAEPFEEGDGGARVRAVRLFAYGDARARDRVRAKIGTGWDDEHDWFVA